MYEVPVKSISDEYLNIIYKTYSFSGAVWSTLPDQ